MVPLVLNHGHMTGNGPTLSEILSQARRLWLAPAPERDQIRDSRGVMGPETGGGFLLPVGSAIPGLPFPFFPGILLSRKPPETRGKRRFLRRKMVEKEWKRSQPPEVWLPFTC